MMFLSNCSDYHELEARFIQLESKYLVLLREYQEPHIGNDHIASFIESILKSVRAHLAPRSRAGRTCTQVHILIEYCEYLWPGKRA